MNPIYILNGVLKHLLLKFIVWNLSKSSGELRFNGTPLQKTLSEGFHYEPQQNFCDKICITLCSKRNVLSQIAAINFNSAINTQVLVTTACHND